LPKKGIFILCTVCCNLPAIAASTKQCAQLLSEPLMCSFIFFDLTNIFSMIDTYVLWPYQIFDLILVKLKGTIICSSKQKEFWSKNCYMYIWAIFLYWNSLNNHQASLTHCNVSTQSSSLTMILHSFFWLFCNQR
jgi:hypothetical protein